ncbi:hypothetical protein KCU61_g733, partial [Aureobasidium melanogenum]
MAAQSVPLDACAVYAGSPNETNLKSSFLLLALPSILDYQDWQGSAVHVKRRKNCSVSISIDTAVNQALPLDRITKCSITRKPRSHFGPFVPERNGLSRVRYALYMANAFNKGGFESSQTEYFPVKVSNLVECKWQWVVVMPDVTKDKSLANSYSMPYKLNPPFDHPRRQ